MGGMRIPLAPPPPPDPEERPSAWPTIRWVAWVVLLSAMVFWGTVTIIR